ncbi:hypothetical protein UlMin_042978 [Ulmus minor]
MSKEASSSRFSARNVSKESNENDFETPLNLNLDPIHFPPPRTPLHTIPDPSQLHQSDFDGNSHSTLHALRPARYSLSDRKLEAAAHAALTCATPRLSARGPKSHSEPNSAQSTPSRNYHRASLGGGTIGPSRLPHSTGPREPSSSRTISIINSQSTADLPHFELLQDSSFWADHNVQVLIRVRPLSTMETLSQGQGRCLKQESAHTLVWLGHPETRFTFDHIACETISQESLFRVAGLPMVENCLSGYNSCMFAYGQTGSGKTYTMMGEIYEIDENLNEDCGLTPRIFEYLFKRITAEEESRRDEQLKYSCKCSFLEIYNEQITDLLEPSSTNLQLREDLKKGVYVENLTEYDVRNVDDVVKLLLQGAANRKVAATHMNCESSRSHSVFTCIIESRWEKDSMAHFRFARLNLVDLAGSERQKGSGAEGERLKEAANINKSLSTLGLVIMSLVDLAHGKQRHVPYRDSRLTFLLQDSLGGNSKTTIIANVSPSICSVNETLSTLKFAQRAKLIQNNAKVNEDASGDKNALQRQIQQLKGQLSLLMKHNYLPRSLPSGEESGFSDLPEEYDSPGEKTETVTHMHAQNKKIKCMEANLVGALRREKMAETALQKLGAEVEQMKILACQNAQHTEMMIKFRDEKIKGLELLLDGTLSSEDYLVQENKDLHEEIELLRSKMDKHTELMQNDVKNNSLQEQLELFQNFYEHGEREKLIAEVSDLRNQLLATLEGQVPFSTNNENQDIDTARELQDCLNMNSKLIREVDELRTELRKNLSCSQTTSHSVRDSLSKDLEEFRQTDKWSLVWSSSMQSDTDNECYMEISSEKNKLEREPVVELENNFPEIEDSDKVMESGKETDRTVLQAKLDRVTKELEDIRLLNSQFQENQVLQLSCQQQTELVCEQVEMETARTILQLQEEVTALQSELDEKLYHMNQENTELRDILATKNEEIRALNMEWERATLELTGFLVDGSRSLKNVSGHIESIACSFPKADVWICETVKRAARVCVEKEETILQLQRSLEDAQNMVMDMKQKLSTLKGVTLALTDFQHLDNDEISKELISLPLNNQINSIKSLHRKLKFKEAQVAEAEKYVDVASIVMNWLFDCQKISSTKIDENDLALEDVVAQVESKSENLYHLLNQIKDELTNSSCRLKVIEDFICPEVNMFECSSIDGGLVHEDAWSPDCSSSSSDFSTESIASDNKLESEAATFFLKKEFKILSDTFNVLHVRLATLVGKFNVGDASDFGIIISFCYLRRLISSCCLADLKQLTASSQSTKEEASASCYDTRKVDANVKMNHARSFLTKFEEAHATIKEADFMLNALLKANENAKKLTCMWEHTGEELMTERGSLIKEVEHLKSSICVKEKENDFLREQANCSLEEIATLMSLLEEGYAQLKSDEEKLKATYADIFSMGMEMLHFVSNSRSLLEDICSEILGKDLSLFVLLQCHLGEMISKLSCMNGETGLHLFGHQESHTLANKMKNIWLGGRNKIMITGNKSIGEGVESEGDNNMEKVDLCSFSDNLIYENLALKNEVKRKEVLLEGLLFDFSLLQESTSSKKDIKEESEKLTCSLSQLRHELEMRTRQFDEMLIQCRKLEGCLTETEESLVISNSNLNQARETIATLSEQNTELKVLLKDLYLKKSGVEDQLEEEKEVVKSLEKEILLSTSSVEKKFISLFEDIEDNLRRVTSERDQLNEEVQSLNDKLEMTYALVDEKEAIAIEARQESEASKLYAEQKEEEVKILEHSVEELESTINVLEKKVCEMNDEVERHRFIRDSLELELQALRQRLSTVENLTENVDSENTTAEQQTQNQISRQLQNKALELHQAHTQLKLLEEEREEQEKEIKQYKEYITELMLHAEAQSSQYQQKYKTLEAMVHEVKIDSTNSTSTVPALYKSEKNSARTRGSSSPFRCIASLVQQMNLERDQDLSAARLRIEELEALADSRQKEVCMLNARLAAAESMTHDVIRDLLGVKLDMNNFANLIDQYQVKKLVEEAHQQAEDYLGKEQEAINLRKQINDLNEERESCLMELSKIEGNLLAAQITVEQLQQRDQLLSAQNDMLKMDKTKLKKKVAELDDLVKTLLGTESTPQAQPTQVSSLSKKSLRSSSGHGDFAKRLEQSEKLLCRVNGELAQYYKSARNRTSRDGLSLMKHQDHRH